MKTSTAVAVVVALIVIAAGVWWFTSQQSTPNTQTSATGTGAEQSSTQASATAPMSATVRYGANGFTPSAVTVAKGSTVTFIADPGADEMWVASDPHPVHSGYDGTTRATHCIAGYAGPAPFDQCAAGASFSFVFDKTGSWGYHNHGNSGDRGTVVVQ